MGHGSVAIVDLGRGGGSLSRELRERLVASVVLVPTDRGAAAVSLRLADVAFRTYEDVGMAPDAPTAEVVRALGDLAAQGPSVLALAGYPFLREGIVTGLLERVGPIEVLPAASPLEVLLLAFDVDSTADLDLVDAAAVQGSLPERGSHLVVTGIANAITAKAVARRLALTYPSDHPAVVAERTDLGYLLRLAPIASLPEQDARWAESAVYVPPVRIAAPVGFDELVRIMALLRAPDGCPWDREQTHMTLRHHLLEEAYETVAAIEGGDDAELVDELGDILLQVVFHAQIASEEGRFTVDDSIAAIIAKLRRRHPHIFGDARADTPDDVIRRWDAIKREEKPGTGLLDGIAPTLPALSYAGKISRRAVGVGFEWETVDDVWDKVNEEIDELKACAPGTPEAEDEVGDLLFTVVNVARKMGVDPEQALRGTCEKFKRRFADMERSAAAEGRTLEEMHIDDMEALWRRAKEGERS
ncbi:MAG: nucleoside triphosphate pyrophosphohydrolase [Coriobacteriia bacterium]|nr:nucleoside triphosphate pyrophosphohydrolase [Coriobacteriia bacterium]